MPRRLDAVALASFMVAALGGLAAIAAAEALTAMGEGVRVALLCTALAVVAVLPALVSMSRQAGRFDLMHPLFFAAWFFFLPQFVVVMLLFAMRRDETFFGLYLADPMRARVTALELAIVGSLGLSAGYLLPLGRRLGAVLPHIRALETSGRPARLLAVLLLAVGLFGAIGAFSTGLLGYQGAEHISRFGALFANLSGLLVAAEAFIFFSLFRRRAGWRTLTLAAVAAALGLAAVSGSRGALFYPALAMVASYQYSRERFRFRHVVAWGLILAASLWAGMVAGSAFRGVKTDLMGRSERLSVHGVIEVQRDAARELGNASLAYTIRFGWERIVERLDGVTSLGVIVTRAPGLAAAERDWRIDRNIVRDAATALVPRFLWPDKPVVGVSQQIGELYFDLEDSSPAVTFMGDLFRNFGTAGVFPGMLLIGVALRAVYVWLIERWPLSPLRVGLFLMISGATNYEGLFSTYFPTLIRALAVAILALALARAAVLVHSAPSGEKAPLAG
jgi:hypothetical protein